jgi:LemA protein
MNTKGKVLLSIIGTLALAGLVLLFVGLGTVLILTIVGAVLAFINVVMLLFVVVSRNMMIRYKNKVKEALALVDIQLKQRFDLIPNLVNVVKGYAKHEKEVLTEVTKLRNLALKSTDEKETIKLANKAVPLMKTLIAVSENYPELKANKVFQNLMEELVYVEDKIVAARRMYDSNVNLYNTKVEVFPDNLVASTFGFEKEELFKIDANEKINIEIAL